jgi:hypothetical protein
MKAGARFRARRFEIVSPIKAILALSQVHAKCKSAAHKNAGKFYK